MTRWNCTRQTPKKRKHFLFCTVGTSSWKLKHEWKWESIKIDVRLTQPNTNWRILELQCNMNKFTKFYNLQNTTKLHVITSLVRCILFNQHATRDYFHCLIIIAYLCVIWKYFSFSCQFDRYNIVFRWVSFANIWYYHIFVTRMCTRIACGRRKTVVKFTKACKPIFPENINVWKHL